MVRLDGEVLRERCPVDFDRRRLPWAMAATINESPPRYEHTLRLIRGLMDEYEIGDDELDIPEPVAHPPAPPDGAKLVAPNAVFFVFDGNAFGLRTVCDAVGLAAQLVPRTSEVRLEEPEAEEPAVDGKRSRL